MTTLRQLRHARTRAATTVRRLIEYMLMSEAPYLSPDGLPSWWPFWSDCLKQRTREAVRAGRLLAEAEGAEGGYGTAERCPEYLIPGEPPERNVACILPKGHTGPHQDHLLPRRRWT